MCMPMLSPSSWVCWRSLSTAAVIDISLCQDSTKAGCSVSVKSLRKGLPHSVLDLLTRMARQEQERRIYLIVQRIQHKGDTDKE